MTWKNFGTSLGLGDMLSLSLCLLCLNILLFTDIFEKDYNKMLGISGEYHKEKRKMKHP